MAPYDVESWGITHTVLNRPVNLVIDMNRYDDLRWGEKEKKDNDSVIRLCKVKEIPYMGLEEYPIKEIERHFGTDYFGSTVDYAVAYALFQEKYKDIHFYGVTYSMESEYFYQKPSLDFWLGMAKGMSVKVTIHGNHSCLLKTRDGLVYGYDTPQKGYNRVE